MRLCDWLQSRTLLHGCVDDKEKRTGGVLVVKHWLLGGIGAPFPHPCWNTIGQRVGGRDQLLLVVGKKNEVVSGLRNYSSLYANSALVASPAHDHPFHSAVDARTVRCARACDYVQIRSVGRMMDGQRKNDLFDNQGAWVSSRQIESVNREQGEFHKNPLSAVRDDFS